MTPAIKTHSRTTHRTPRSLRSAANLGLGLLSLLSLSAGHAAFAGTVNWDGTASDWFSNPSHWVGGVYPGAGDDAANMSTAAMTLGQSTTINSFFSNGAFTLQGGTFTGNQGNSLSTLTVNNVFTDDGGQINNFTVNQGKGGSVVFTTNGGNSLSGDIFNAAVNLSASNAYVRLFNTNTFNNQVSLGASGANGIHLYDGNSNFIIGTSGSLTGFGGVVQDNGGATLTNNGTVNATSKTLNLALTNFNNASITEATNSATLTLNNTNTTNTGTLAAHSGGILDISGTLNSSAGSMISGTGGAVNIMGATLLGTLNTDANTALEFNTDGNNTLNGTTVNGNLDLSTNSNAYVRLFGVDTVNGAVSLGASGSNGIHLYDGNSNFVVGPKGSLTGFGGVVQDNGGATLTNTGTVNANSSGNTLNLALSNFNNSGTAEATNGGTLTLNSTNTTNTGTLAAHSGGILDVSGTLTSSAGNLLDGTGGTLNVMGATLLGTLNLASGSSLVFDTNGNNALNGTMVNGNLDLATNSNAYVRMFGIDTVNGAVSLGASGANGIHLYDGNSNFIVGTNGSLTGFGGVVQDNGGATLTNNGLINASSAAAPLVLALTNFNNNGITEATGGATLNLRNAFTNAANGSSLAAIGTGSIVSIAGIFTGTGNDLITASKGGQAQVNGATLLGTINTDAATALVFDTNGGNTLNTTTVNGNLDLATNSNAYVHLFGVDTVNGNVSLGASGANGIHLYDGNANLVLNSSLTGFGGVVQDNGGATLTSNGTVNANSNGNTLTLALSNFNNAGTSEATNGGTLTLNNTDTNNTGILAAHSGGILDISGTLNSNAGNSINGVGGTVNVTGATLLGTVNETAGTTLVFNTDGNNNLNNTTVNGNLDLSTNSNAYVRLFGVDTVNGAVSLGASGSNGIHLYDGNSNFIIGSGGSLTGFGSVVQDNGGATLTNTGTVNANVSGQTLNINTTAFNNTGTVQVQNGAALSVTSTNTDSGNILVKKGGTATFTQGMTQMAGLTQVDGTLSSSLTLTGGTLSGSGTVNGNVANNGGMVAAGSPFGTLAVSGTFSQASGGTLDAVFSNSQNNLLKVSGAVTTGGLLSVNYLGSGPFTAGNAPFTFLNYGSLTSSITGAGPTQYFSNETFDTSGNGLIAGSNGFTYELLNNTSIDGLQLEVLQNGAPTPAVPEASTTISMGLLLALGGGGLLIAKRRRTATVS